MTFYHRMNIMMSIKIKHLFILLDMYFNYLHCIVIAADATNAAAAVAQAAIQQAQASKHYQKQVRHQSVCLRALWLTSTTKYYMSVLSYCKIYKHLEYYVKYCCGACLVCWSIVQGPISQNILSKFLYLFTSQERFKSL